MPYSEMEILTRLLRTLKNKRPEYSLLRDLAQESGISMDELSAALERLRAEDYEIENHPAHGLRLSHSPNSIAPWEIISELPGDLWLDNPMLVLSYEEVDSTNEVAKDLARRGAPDGTLCVANHQTRGKGRQGRKWLSAPGKNLLFTILLRPKIDAYRLPFLTILASTAVAAALREEYGLAVGLKWPNDLVLEGKKLGGILTEGQGLEGNVHFAVVGVGLNINGRQEDLPSGISEIATSLVSSLGYELHRAEVLASILNRLRRYYKQLLEGNHATILDTWKALSDTIGKYVELGDHTTGYAEDIDHEGALILRMDNGARRRLWVGDLTQLF